MTKKITITVPCYNQTTLFKRNLFFLKSQTLKDFNIVILDNNSTEDYKKVISDYPDFNIEYIKNKTNTGAIRNIFASILYNDDSPYKISLHEDDILHPQYLEKTVKILDDNKDVAFVCTLAEWFKDENELKTKFDNRKDIPDPKIIDKDDFIRMILDGKHIMLVSVVYRNSFLNEDYNLEKYDVLCDRPFLISLIKDHKVAVIDDKCVFIRDHGENDGRFKTITEENLFNMMAYYKNNLPQPLNESDYKKFMTCSTNNIINTYPEIKTQKQSFIQFVKTGKKLGLIDFKYLNKIGFVGLLKVIFGFKTIDKLIRFIKK